jgi:hypothetical protein
MLLTQVNASQLMSSFLGGEKEKIGQGIVASDFGGELKKLISPTAGAAKREADVSTGDAGIKPGKESGTEPGSAASTAGTLDSCHETKGTLSSVKKQQKSTANPKSKISAIEAKAKEQKNLLVTNPAITESVLADLKYPAETIKACKDILNKDGSISIKDLKLLLSFQSASDPGSGAQVPAEHARVLVESIIAKNGENAGKASASGEKFNSSVKIKEGGSYSSDEFRGLLDNVLEEAESRRTLVSDLKLEQGSRGTTQTTTKAANTAQTIDLAQVPKTGQTEMLTTTILPSFILDDHEGDPAGKVPAATAINAKPEAQSGNAADDNQNSSEALSNGLKSDKLSSDKILSEQAGLQAPSSPANALTEGSETGSSSNSEYVSFPARQSSEDASIKDLEPILKNFDAKIVSVEPQQHPETATDAAAAPGESHQGLIAQVQNLAFQVKGAEKQADKPGEGSNSETVREIAEQSGTDPLKTVSAEHPSDGTPSDGSTKQFAAADRQSGGLSAQLNTEEAQARFGEILGQKQTDTQIGNMDNVARSAVFKNSDYAGASEKINPSEVETVSDHLNSDTLPGDNIPPKGEGSATAASALETGIEGGKTGSSSGAAASMLAEGSDPVSNTSNPEIISGTPQQQLEKNDSAVSSAADLHESPAAQVLNPGSEVNGAEKQADGAGEPASSEMPSLKIAELPGTEIEAASKSQGSRNPGFQVNGAEKQADGAGEPATSEMPSLKTAELPETEIEAASKSPGSDKSPVSDRIAQEGEGFQETTTGTELPVVGGSAKSPSDSISASHAARQGETSNTSVNDLAQGLKYFAEKIVSPSQQPQSGANVSEAVAAKGPPEGMPAQAQNLVSQVKGGEKQTDKTRVTSSSGISSQDIAEQSGADTVKATSGELSSNDTPGDTTENQFVDTAQQTEVEAPAAKSGSESLQAQFGDVLNRNQVETQLAAKDAVQQNAVFNNSASTLQGEQIDLPKTDNPARSGSDYYDPNRSAEFMQDAGERLTGTAGRQLVLDMDSDGLGKISIKVGSKKDEISVTALTQSEPAKEALMRNATELRQDLQDQGLVLGKFTVDVNGGKSDNGNYPEANYPGGKVTPPPKETRDRDIKTPVTRVYSTKRNGRSQISLFA